MKLNLNRLSVLERVYNPDADAWLVLARIERTPGKVVALGHYCIGWQPRNPTYDNALYDSQIFMEDGTARAAFLKERATGEMPIDAVFDKDWQQQTLYDWEYECLSAFGHDISQKECRKLMLKIGRDYGIRTPGLIWKEHTNFSEHDTDENTVYFGHRDNLAIIHEMAHAVHIQNAEEKTTAAHVPGFVWVLIELYNRYAGINLSYMTVSAMQRGLTGDMGSDSVIQMNVKPSTERTPDVSQKKTGSAPRPA